VFKVSCILLMKVNHITDSAFWAVGTDYNVHQLHVVQVSAFPTFYRPPLSQLILSDQPLSTLMSSQQGLQNID
jgi:hypothetical protein